MWDGLTNITLGTMTGLGTYFKEAKPSVYRIAYVLQPPYTICYLLTLTVYAPTRESVCLDLASTP